jgi:hypothetical protein
LVEALISSNQQFQTKKTGAASPRFFIQRFEFMRVTSPYKNNMITGIVMACVLVIAVMMIVNITGNRAVSLIGDENKTDVTATAETTATVTIEAVTRDSTSAANSMPESPRTQAEVSQSNANVNIDTKPPVIEVTLAPVEVPDEKVIAILEEHDVQPTGVQGKNNAPASQSKSVQSPVKFGKNPDVQENVPAWTPQSPMRSSKNDVKPVDVNNKTETMSEPDSVNGNE